MAIEQILSLLQHTAGKASRSTALQPLAWLLVILGAILLGAFRYQSTRWIAIVLMSFLGLGVFVYLGSYIFLLLNNIDATRSERFTLEKMALQQSQLGDDQAGFLDASEQRPLLPSQSADISHGEVPEEVE